MAGSNRLTGCLLDVAVHPDGVLVRTNTRHGFHRGLAAGDSSAEARPRERLDTEDTEGGPMDVATLAELLRETAEHHGHYEATHPKHDWWDWYAPYLSAREDGSTPDEAAQAAGLYMEEARGIAR
jgi:hypothetical protein